MQFDNLDEVGNAAQVIFLVRLAGKPLDRDRDGRVWLFLSSGISQQLLVAGTRRRPSGPKAAFGPLGRRRSPTINIAIYHKDITWWRVNPHTWYH